MTLDDEVARGSSESLETEVGGGPQEIGEQFAELSDEGFITEVIRPAAIVPETAARAILVELSLQDVRNGGVWAANPAKWVRYHAPWHGSNDHGEPEVIGSIQVAYGTPTKYQITIYRVTITERGSSLGWTVESLCDEALGYGELDLATCPRAKLNVPPKPFTY